LECVAHRDQSLIGMLGVGLMDSSVTTPAHLVGGRARHLSLSIRNFSIQLLAVFRANVEQRPFLISLIDRGGESHDQTIREIGSRGGVTSRRPHMSRGLATTDIRPAITRRRPSTLVSVSALVATAGTVDMAATADNVRYPHGYIFAQKVTSDDERSLPIPHDYPLCCVILVGLCLHGSRLTAMLRRCNACAGGSSIPPCHGPVPL
jgi:hypothetical protein